MKVGVVGEGDEENKEEEDDTHFHHHPFLTRGFDVRVIMRGRLDDGKDASDQSRGNVGILNY